MSGEAFICVSIALSCSICCFKASILSCNRPFFSAATSGSARSAVSIALRYRSMLSLITASRRFIFAAVKFLSRSVDRLELAAVDRHQRLREQVQLPAQHHELPAPPPIALPLSFLKLAIVLKSGINRPVSHISSMLRCVSCSSRRLDCTRFR